MAVLLLASCAGYHLGETKPPVMKGVKTIDVRMFSNETFLPRANAVVTSAVAAAPPSAAPMALPPCFRPTSVCDGPRWAAPIRAPCST